ncbi:MAG: LON peptidase substrate-binding domain-containing protein [Chitinophagales bacterium]
MQKFLPIFPLAMVAFPGEKLNLHVFEPRYKQLIRECIRDDKHFGIPVVHKKEIQEYGTEMRIQKIQQEYDNGEMDITVEGVQVFRVLDIINEVPDKLYSGAVVSMVSNIMDKHNRLFAELRLLTDRLFTLLDIRDTIEKKDFVLQSFSIGHYVGFELEDELELLRHPRESTRQKIIVEHIKKILPNVEQYAEIREKARMNGSFRLLKPPDGL